MNLHLKEELQLRRDDFIWYPAFILAAFLFGVCLFFAVMRGSEENVYTPIGGIVMCFAWVCIVGAVAFSQMTTGFRVAVSMGRPRMEYFMGNLLATLLEAWLLAALGLLLCAIEEGVGRLLLGEMKISFLIPFIKWFLPAGFLLVAVMSFVGAADMKFYRVARSVNMILFISLCWTPALFGDSLSHLWKTWNISPVCLLLLMVGIGIVMTAGSGLLCRKQEVRM